MFFAISGLGWGGGESVHEALENYVQSQLANIPASQTIFKTKKAWEAALRTGEAKAEMWEAPHDAIGFEIGIGEMVWRLRDGNTRSVTQDQRLF